MEQEIYDSINKVKDPKEQLVLKILCLLLFSAVTALGWQNREQRNDIKEDKAQYEKVRMEGEKTRDTLRAQLNRCQESKFTDARSDYINAREGLQKEKERSLRIDSLERIIKRR